MKKNLEPRGELWLGRGGENLLGETRFALLEAIDRTGSITRAGKETGISYRTAWDTVDRLNALSEKPWVIAAAGGKSGGGTRLTPYGREMLGMFAAFKEEHGKFLAGLRRNLGDLDRFRRLARKTSLKVSARNQIWGVVDSLRMRGLSAEVTLKIAGRGLLRAAITRTGLESMELREGDEAYALIKANWVTVEAAAAPAAATARGGRAAAGTNRWPGTIVDMSRSGDEAEIHFQSDAGTPLTIHLVSGAGSPLAKGLPVLAKFRPEDVILGVAP